MTPDETDLGRQLVACEQWRWMPGMALADAEGRSWRLDECDDWGGAPPVRLGGTWHPDLTDAATAGGLLAMLAEAGDEHQDWHAGPDSTGFRIWLACLAPTGPEDPGNGNDGYVGGATLGEACARALLALWTDAD